MYPLTTELKRTAGVFAETAWAGAAYYLLLYMLASHVRDLLYIRSVASYIAYLAMLFGLWLFCAKLCA